VASYSHVVIVGNLTRDPELRHTPQGTAVCDISVAVNRKWTTSGGERKEEVSYFDCVAWAKAAEMAAKYLAKGRPVLIDGELRQERWEKDGAKHSRVKVHVGRIQFLGAPKGASSEEAPQEANAAGGDDF